MPRSKALKASTSKPRGITKRSPMRTATRLSARQRPALAKDDPTYCAAPPRMLAAPAQEEEQEGEEEQIIWAEADEEQEEVQSTPAMSRGKERAYDEILETANSVPEERPFPLMELPAEIRNEIYRACLTRPFNILLSKQELAPIVPPAKPVKKNVGASSEPMNGARLSELLDTVRTNRRGGNSRSGRHHARLLREDLDDVEVTSGRSLRPRQATGPALPTPTAPSSNSTSPASTASGSSTNAPAHRVTNWRVVTRSLQADIPRVRRTQNEDPLVVNILRLNKQIYDEARSILYSENNFTLDLDTATSTLAALHQRSRRQIKHVELEIPCYNEILERFQETVRLSLRYCWGLRTFVIHMPFTLPGADGSSTTGNTTVYANGFDILRWLPRQCEVQLKGRICKEISAVVSKNANLAKSLDELAYARRQLISNETERTAPARCFS